MTSTGFFDRRVRGFRIVEIGGLAVLLVLVLAVYLSKAGAGGERADIDHVQQQIGEEQTRIRLLQAEVASLERPERLESLSGQYLGLQPIPAKHEVQADALPDLALIQRVGTIADPGQPNAAQAAPAQAAPAQVPAQPDSAEKTPAPAAPVAAPARPQGAR